MLFSSVSIAIVVIYFLFFFSSFASLGIPMSISALCGQTLSLCAIVVYERYCRFSHLFLNISATLLLLGSWFLLLSCPRGSLFYVFHQFFHARVWRFSFFSIIYVNVACSVLLFSRLLCFLLPLPLSIVYSGICVTRPSCSLSRVRASMHMLIVFFSAYCDRGYTGVVRHCILIPAVFLGFVPGLPTLSVGFHLFSLSLCLIPRVILGCGSLANFLSARLSFLSLTVSFHWVSSPYWFCSCRFCFYLISPI